MAHVAGAFLHKFHVARVKKYRRTREDVSLQHVPETHPGNFFTSVPTLRFGTCFISLLHSPARCPVSVYLRRFCPCYILQQHVPAVCPLVWAHLYSCNRLTPRLFFTRFNYYNLLTKYLNNRSTRMTKNIFTLSSSDTCDT